jgi:hypothetical protein
VTDEWFILPEGDAQKGPPVLPRPGCASESTHVRGRSATRGPFRQVESAPGLSALSLSLSTGGEAAAPNLLGDPEESPLATERASHSSFGPKATSSSVVGSRQRVRTPRSQKALANAARSHALRARGRPAPPRSLLRVGIAACKRGGRISTADNCAERYATSALNSHRNPESALPMPSNRVPKSPAGWGRAGARG